MHDISLSVLTVCGLEELDQHGARGVTHVLSILDPDQAEPAAFRAYTAHRREVLRFHDTIEPLPGKIMPERGHVEAILEFGRSLAATADAAEAGAHLLVHCHAGISRSTAAMAMVMALAEPQRTEEDILAHLVSIRPKAWPNSRMMAFADEFLGRGGRFTPALGRLYKRQLIAYPNVRAYMIENARGYEVGLADAA